MVCKQVSPAVLLEISFDFVSVDVPDRVSNRCISRMDHFCPWTNNSIGAKNQKHFFLFLIYTDLASMYLYVYLSLHLVSFF